jgi:hypothetical protein
MQVYHLFAQTLDALRTSEKRGNSEWIEIHTRTLRSLAYIHLPSGSGFDNGPAHLDLARSGPDRLVFTGADFHHMDENGMYDGWTEHTVVVTPSLAHGFTVRVTGRDRNEIKSYIADTFHAALSARV